MTLNIVSDRRGNIVSISQFGDVGDKISGITTAGIQAEPGHHIHEIEVPEELGGISLLDLHKSYKVEISKGVGCLVKA